MAGSARCHLPSRWSASCASTRASASWRHSTFSGATATLSLTDYAAVRPLPECGFVMKIEDQTAILPAHGAFFATVVPAHEWEEEAALAFA